MKNNDIINEEKLRKLIRSKLLNEDVGEILKGFQKSWKDIDASLYGVKGWDAEEQAPEPDGAKAAFNAKYADALKKLEDEGVDTSDIRNGTEFTFPVEPPCYNAGYDVPTMGAKKKKNMGSIPAARKALKGRRTELVHAKYGIQNNDWTSKHKGIDIFCLDGQSRLIACVTGIITKIGINSGKGGNTITITRGDPNNAENFYYAHMNRHEDGFGSKEDIGKKVTMKTPIGWCGKTGSAQGTYPHLHFSYYVGGNYFNSNTNPWPKYLEDAIKDHSPRRLGNKRGLKDYPEITPEEAEASIAACSPKKESVTITEDELREAIGGILRRTAGSLKSLGSGPKRHSDKKKDHSSGVEDFGKGADIPGINPGDSWQKKTLFGVIARGGKSKKFTHVLALDGGTVGIAHFAAGGLNGLYDAMGDSVTQKYFGKTVSQMKAIDCRNGIPSGKNDDGRGCYTKSWWKNGMKKFVASPESENIQVAAWNKRKGNRAYNHVKNLPGWNTERSWAIAAGIANSVGVGGMKKIVKGRNPEEALAKYVGNNAHRRRRAQAINTVFPKELQESVFITEAQIREAIGGILKGTASSLKSSGDGPSGSSDKKKDKKDKDRGKRKRSGKGIGAKDLKAVEDPNTHWNFSIDDPVPDDWNIKNFTPKEIMSRGNKRVVADKKALQALDMCASRASQYGHPPLKLTNQVKSDRNGAYRDPAYNKKQGGASKSRHQYGDGFDIWTKNFSKEERIAILKNLADAGFHSFGHGRNNIHADMRPGKSAQWNYGGYPIPDRSKFT